MLRRIGLTLAYPLLLMRRRLDWAWALQNRERLRLLAEMAQMRGLMELLMKQRNGYRWTEVDRKRIKVQLRKLASLSPYLVLFLAPGGFLALPVLVWWLDRQSAKQDADDDPSIAE